MKSLYTTFLMILLACSWAGCVDTIEEPFAGGQGSEVEVSFQLAVPQDDPSSTGYQPASFSGNSPEYLIQKIAVLAFKVNPDQTEYFDYYAEGKLIAGAGTPKQTFSATLRVKEHKQRLVVIANAHDQVMKLIGSVAWGKAPKDEMLKMLACTNTGADHKWHASNSADFTPFPMWGELSNAQLITPATASVSGIPMLRMVAKIDIALAENGEVVGQNPREHFKLSEVYLYNVKDNGLVVPDRTALTSGASAELMVNKPTLPSKLINWEGPLKYVAANEVSLTDEIYTLEAQATDLSKNRLGATGLVIGGYYSEDGVHWDTAPSYYRLDLLTADKKSTLAILRNTNYKIRIVEVKGPGHVTPKKAWNGDPSVELMVADWTIRTVAGDVRKRQLNTSAANVSITGMSSSRIYFWSDQQSVRIEGKGLVGATGNTPFEVNDYFDDLAGGGNTSMFHYNPSSGEGYMDIATLMVNEVNNDVRRIYLNAGGLKREITIQTQLNYKPRPFDTFAWVGTFHRNNEVGERVIYSDHVGEWKVEVDDPQQGGKFVILSKVPSSNKKLGSDSPGNAEDYPVLNGVKSVSGKGRIFFRVGMNSTYTPTAAAPARYATLTVRYSGGVAKLYVRQGEAADFLMRNGDAPNGVSDISGTDRKLAKKMSPYNLTDASGRSGRVGNYSATKHTFTAYPSQAGYYFQWNKTYAWSPDGEYATNWDRLNISKLWEMGKFLYESCPQGYHRPNDGSTSSYVLLPTAKGSEIRQSLYVNPRDATPGSGDFKVWGHDNFDNSIWGYCADGFFDRRTPRSSIDKVEASMVGSGAQIAYVGRLFYNPYTKASLFFPASGVRYDGVLTITPGRIQLSGSRAHFWTTTKYNASYPMYQTASPERSLVINSGNLMGFPIRCMKNE